jgi:hypothetical protein
MFCYADKIPLSKGIQDEPLLQLLVTQLVLVLELQLVPGTDRQALVPALMLGMLNTDLKRGE